MVLEFGAAWCGVCAAAAPLIAAARDANPTVQHLRIEDGPGRVLGRSFRIKLWPTLVFLHNGREVARVVRPHTPADLNAAYSLLELAQQSQAPLDASRQSLVVSAGATAAK